MDNGSTLKNVKLKTLLKLLKKYSLKDKLNCCFVHALKITHVDGIELTKDNQVYPWELEYLVELCLLSGERKGNKHWKEDDFVYLVNCIRNHRPQLFNAERIDPKDLVDDFLISLGANQFKIQEDYFFRLFRFQYIFSFANEEIDVGKEFERKFNGVSFSAFCDFALMLRLFLTEELVSVIKERYYVVINLLLNRYRNVIEQISITNKEYKVKQSKVNNNKLENGITGLNYIRTYPFIMFEGNYYLPLPYLIIDAVTESLFTRLTDANDGLRSAVGKHVAEKYLFDILNEGKIYDEIHPEKLYNKGHNCLLSPDVMVRKGNYVCLFDSKLNTPKVSIRNLEEEAIRISIDRYSTAVKQLYNRIKEFHLYNPFDDNKEIPKENIFGIVTVYEESYVSREKVIEKTFEKLNIDSTSKEAEYIASHIMVVAIANIELFALNTCDIFPALIKRQNDEKNWYDYRICSDHTLESRNRIPAFNELIARQNQLSKVLITDLANKGLWGR